MRADDLPGQRVGQAVGPWHGDSVQGARHVRPALGEDLGGVPRERDAAAAREGVRHLRVIEPRHTPRLSARRPGARQFATRTVSGAVSSTETSVPLARRTSSPLVASTPPAPAPPPTAAPSAAPLLPPTSPPMPPPAPAPIPLLVASSLSVADAGP